MAAPLQTVLILLVLLQVKHLFADFFMQTPRMLADRDRVLHLGRLQHTLLHGAFSLVIFVIFGTPLVVALGLSAAETAVHYLIDFIKGRHTEKAGHGPEDAGYWRAFGTDQLAHQLTYVVMVWAWASLMF